MGKNQIVKIPITLSQYHNFWCTGGELKFEWMAGERPDWHETYKTDVYARLITENTFKMKTLAIKNNICTIFDKEGAD